MDVHALLVDRWQAAKHFWCRTSRALRLVQLALCIVDSGCSHHPTDQTLIDVRFVKAGSTWRSSLAVGPLMRRAIGRLATDIAHRLVIGTSPITVRCVSISSIAPNPLQNLISNPITCSSRSAHVLATGVCSNSFMLTSASWTNISSCVYCTECWTTGVDADCSAVGQSLSGLGRAGASTMTLVQGPLKASDLFVQALENEGILYIFGVPGDGTVGT